MAKRSKPDLSAPITPTIDAESQSRVQALIRENGGRSYVYVLRRPNGDPFYVGKGVSFRVLQHEAEAKGYAKTHKLNVIRSLWRKGLAVTHEIAGFFDDESTALASERELIQQFGRYDLGRGPLTNQTDGGEGTSNPSEASRQKHRDTLGGTVDDGSERSAVNRFFQELGKQHDSVPVKPISEFKPTPLTPHPQSRAMTLRQAQALAASAVASRVVIPPFLGDLDCRIHAAVFCFNFWTGAIPPSPMLGRSLL